MFTDYSRLQVIIAIHDLWYIGKDLKELLDELESRGLECSQEFLEEVVDDLETEWDYLHGYIDED